MKASKLISIFVLLFVLLSPTISTQAQTSATVENFFGEGSFMDGYDFSANAVQRWGESGPDNPGLSPDFYLGDSNTPVTTPDYHSPKATIDYGTTPLASITEIPSQSDSRFANNMFVQGRTYGMFTNEGDYVVIQVTSLYEQPFDDWHINGMTFNWMYVGGGSTGDLTLSLYPYDKTEFALGDSPTIGGDVLVGGQPLENAQVCTEVKGDTGEYMYGVCHFTDANGQFSFWLEYEVNIPAGYRGNLVVEANVVYNDTIAEQTIYVSYGNEALDPPLNLVLIGPDHPIEIGGWEDIAIAGTVTSQGMNVDGALVTMKVAGQTFQTTTGTHTSGQFNWYWANNSFPAGNYWVEVTITKNGYQSVTDNVPFTLIGEGYNYWVTMDPIPASLDPGDQVPFPGALTFGGQPHYDWIEVDVTFPNGRTNTYLYETGADGLFTHIQPTINEIGTYQLVVFRHDNRVQISDVYTFSVGSTPTPTITPTPTPAPLICKIIDVVYPSIIVVGENVDVTGKVICTEGYDGEEVIPQEGWYVTGYANYAFSSINQTQNKTVTVADGVFKLTLTIQDFKTNALHLVATELEDYTGNRAHRWFGPLNVVVGLNPDIRLSQTDYDQGELVEGTLTFNPSTYEAGWDNDLEIYYLIAGPAGGAEKKYLFESYGYQPDDGDRFQWQIPYDAEGGNYTVTAYLSGSHIQTQTVEVQFFLTDVRHTILTAVVEPGPDEWTSADLQGQFTDHEGVPIPDAEVRVVLFEWESEPIREFTLQGSTDNLGVFVINLEPLDKFSGQGQDDPWLNRFWSATVYADKEGYATGAVILGITIPTVTPQLEIISVSPPLDYLSKMTSGGMRYDQLVDMNFTVRVRYNNLFGQDAKFSVDAGGYWAFKCAEQDGPYHVRPYLSINGEEMPSWDSVLSLRNMRAWYGEYGWQHAYWYPYPILNVKVPASQGFGQETKITVSGKLFGYSISNDDTPRPCSTGSYQDNPSVPPSWLMRPSSGAWVGISLGRSNASVSYNLSPPSVSAIGSAWVTPTSGEFNALVSMGQATGFILPNQTVKLSIVAKDLTTGEETSTDEITLAGSAATDDHGKIKLSLEAKTNPCELVEKASYFVEITVPGFEGTKIPIQLRCIERMSFAFNPDDILVLQAVDLSIDNPIELASGKETGVRVLVWVNGEFMQPENGPVEFDIRFELLQEGSNIPIFPQTKTVSLSEKGASVRWADSRLGGNQTGIGEVIQWENNRDGVVGMETVPLDFAFTPHELGGNQTYRIRITVDPDEVFGESVVVEKAPITVKKMKRLQILFVPVQRPYTIFNMNISFVFKQIKFVTDAYPLAPGDIGWSIAPNFIWDDAITLLGGAAKYTYLGRLAIALEDKYGGGGGSNIEYRVVGVVPDEVWLQDTFGISSEATGSQFGNNVTLLRYPKAPYNTLAHEIGHTLGLYYTTWLDKIQGKSQEQYELHPPDGIRVYGLIFRNGKIYDIDANENDPNVEWRAAFEGATQIDVFDLMGSPDRYGGYYQAPWVVPSTYKALFTALKDPPGEPVLYLRGGVDDEEKMHLDVLSVSEGLPDPPSEEGFYHLKILSSGEEVLYSTFFDIKFGEPGDVPIFALKMPSMPGMARIVVEREGELLAEAVRSGNHPTINMVRQPEGHMDETTLSWRAEDLDGDSLRYELSYQCDGGAFWHPIDTLTEGTQYVLDTTWLPGGESCLVRVTASDGFNTTETISDPFFVVPKGPAVHILTEEGSTFPADDHVLLRGAAMDLEDGVIPDERLHWTSDIDGELGSGSVLPVLLSMGTHQITLYAKDSAGNTALAQILLEVTAAGTESEPLTGMGSGLQSLWLIGLVALAALMGMGALFFTWLVLRKRRKPATIAVQDAPGRQPGTVQDDQGRWWYQDPGSGAWSLWNGTAWQPAAGGLPPATTPSKPFWRRSGAGSCLFTLIVAFVMAVVIVGGISLAAFNVFPGIQIQSGQGDLTEILKWEGGGFLVSILGLLLLNSGFKTIITRRVIVEDEVGRRKEKRGFSAIINGLVQLLFSILLLSGGLGMMTMIFYKEIVPYFGF